MELVEDSRDEMCESILLPAIGPVELKHDRSYDAWSVAALPKSPSKGLVKAYMCAKLVFVVLCSKKVIGVSQIGNRVSLIIVVLSPI